MKINNKTFGITKALAFLLALVISVSLLPLSAFAEANASAPKAAAKELDYIGDKYGLDDHVFDILTFDRLNLLLLESRVNEKSVIVFADDQSPTARKAIPEINKKSKELGIEKVYYFDFVLAGENGVNIWDAPEETWLNAVTEDDVPVSQDLVIVKKILQNTTALRDVPQDFTAANDVFLFVLEGSGEAQENDEELALSTSISKSLLIKDDNVSETDIEETLSDVIENGVSTASSYSQFDYFNNAIWRSNASREFYENYDKFEDNFKLRAVTIYEFLYLLEQEGEHIILVSGSWCGDSKLALPFVIENSYYRDSDTIYVLDFKLTGGFDQPWSYRTYLSDHAEEFGLSSYSLGGTGIIGTEGATRITLLTRLGAKIMEKFGSGYPVGDANTVRDYVVDGKITLNDDGKVVAEYATTSDKSFRSPYLARYNKDAEKPIVDTWLYKVTEYDSNIDQEVGTYKDYELNSGGFSAEQLARGRYELALFFGAEDVSYTHHVPNISENPGADSGCGDENDTLDDQGQETLIPYHGSKQYDVTSYRIDVTLNESSSTPANSTFNATTVITATAVNELNGSNLSFDFRNIDISSVTVKDLTADKVIAAEYSQLNNDAQDRQKLNIALSENIASGDEFEVTVVYKLYTVDYSVSEFGSPQGFTVHVDGQGYTAAGEPFGATYWFPCNNTPADGARYEITLHAPAGYIAVSNGVKEKTFVDDNGYDAVAWKLTQDTAPYQIFATFSKNLIELKQEGEADENGNVQNPLFTTADGREIPIYAYVNKDIYSDINNRYRADRYFALLPEYIRSLERLFGAYPGEALGFVFENVGDGNGGSAGWGAIETRDRPLYTSTGIINENTFVHEFIHQWFGDAVRLEQWKELWLNEGFATLGTDLYFELTEENASFTVDDAEIPFTTSAKFKALWESKDENSIFWDTPVALINKETYLFGGPSIAYNKGALALAVLRDGIGDDAFLETLRTWVSENNGSTGTTESFIALAERISGKDLTGFADTWLYCSEKPATFTLGSVQNQDGADTEISASIVSDDNSVEQDSGNDAWVTMIIIAGVAVIVAVVIIVVIGKKKSSGEKQSH
ncbi:MAG: hypothetical protein NC084_08665 [Bacteroides sp.]|nr:hypothetical protein [Eubacterium sp.]MCM1418216.1 hypothetical protein [Roseburia sp.]MCM1462767.1 hypothetical protein [Bacteroides sp.]